MGAVLALARCSLLFKQHTYPYITLHWLEAWYGPHGSFHFLRPVGKINRTTASIESTTPSELSLPHGRPLGCYAIVKELYPYGLQATSDLPEGDEKDARTTLKGWSYMFGSKLERVRLPVTLLGKGSQT